MISAKLTKTKDSCFFKVNGHANYNPGNDIVCASASMLVFTLKARILELGYGYRHDSDINNGNALIMFERNDDTDAVLQTILCGFRLLSEEYPDCVELKGDI